MNYKKQRVLQLKYNSLTQKPIIGRFCPLNQAQLNCYFTQNALVKFFGRLQVIFQLKFEFKSIFNPGENCFISQACFCNQIYFDLKFALAFKYIILMNGSQKCEQNQNDSKIISDQDQAAYNQQQRKFEQPEEQKKQQEIDQINPITLLKNPELFRSTFFDLTKLGLQFFKKKQFEKGLNALNKCIDMLDLGKNNLKDISKYWKVTIFANLAYGYQVTRKLQKCNRFCERTKEQLERLINCNEKQQNSKDKYLKLSKFLVTLKFQHCAIVSQLEQHDKALQMCKSTLPQLKKQIQLLLLYLQENSASRLLEKKNGETVQFSKQVHKFAQATLNELIRFLNQPLKKSHFYYWQKNPQQNQEQVRKKFIPNTQLSKQDCKRSILGVSKSTHWIDQFNIGSIMHMSMISVQSFQIVLPMEEYLFKDKLYQLVILCSLSYFTMATQIRFIEPLNLNSKQAQKNQIGGKIKLQLEQVGQRQEQNLDNNSKMNIGKIKNPGEQILKKYGYQEKSELFQLSELYHLRSIQIVSRNIQTIIPYLMHIIKSYDKHYLKKKQLEAIAAINQESQMQMSLNQSVQEYLPEDKIYDNYMKKQSKNQQLMEQLLLQSQNQYSPKTSRNNGQGINQTEDFFQVKNILDFSSIKQPGQKRHNEQSTQKQKQQQKLKFNSHLNLNSNLSKIKQEPKLQSQIHLYSRNKEGSHQNSHEVVSSEYLQSIKTLERVKSPNMHKKQNKKSKSKLILLKIKSSSKQPANTSRSHKSIYTNYGSFGSPKHYNHKNYAQTKNQNIENFKKKNMSKSKQKIIGIAKHIQKAKSKHSQRPRDIYTHKSPKGHADNEQKARQKQKRHETNKDSSQKRQKKYYTEFDGEKQYRIKHESTTHIKVLYKKKDNLGGK